MFSRELIKKMYLNTNSNGILLVPSLDYDASFCDIEDRGRIFKCTLHWEKEEALEAADEFEHFVGSLFEIGEWYANSEETYGSKPDTGYMDEEKTMSIWERYIWEYPEYEKLHGGIQAFCEAHDIKGYAANLFTFLVNSYCKLNAYDAPMIVLASAEVSLAYAYVINRFAGKVERIDFLMDDVCQKSYFEPVETLTHNDLLMVTDYLSRDKNNIRSEKSGYFLLGIRLYGDTDAVYQRILEDTSKYIEETENIFERISGAEAYQIKREYCLVEGIDSYGNNTTGLIFPKEANDAYTEYLFRKMTA